MHLRIGSALQGGKYRVEQFLGLGGFGITYIAIQVGLNRKVAIKEFFMKDICNRDASTSHVSVPSVGSKELVEKYKKKFIKEAQMIAGLSHENIIKIHDIFEENGTAYYVMEYHSGDSLKQLVDLRGKLSESDSLYYIRQVASALSYLHKRSINHLDVKPGNILLSSENNAVLIDFGLSKHYDDGGKQTTTTPVGISQGYAPQEQYKKGGVGEFSPSTDIYSLGATLFKLLTGKTPPEASDVSDFGLPSLPVAISASTRNAVKQCMQPRRLDRPQSIEEFLKLLDGGGDEIVADSDVTMIELPKDDKILKGKDESASLDRSVASSVASEKDSKGGGSKKWLFGILGAVMAVILAVVFWPDGDNSGGNGRHETVNVNTEMYVDPTLNSNSSSESINGLSVRWGSGVTSSQKEVLRGLMRNMVSVSGGTFMMGANPGDSDAGSHEKPSHSVTLSGYRICKYEVTQREWLAVMGSNPSRFKGDNLPVERVSWNDCQAFIQKLNSLTGLSFRLPTEAEWEFAARGGNRSIGYKYSGGDNIGSVAWYDGNSGSTTHPIGQKQGNELGLYDMSGNVYEWCSDWYDNSYYASSPSTNPKGPSSGSYRVYRGGGWDDNARHCRVSGRNDYYYPSLTINDLGLRLAL